ncbi:MAG TPA: Sir2 family NAD-dependent protein deacetylase [Flavobacteriales bacterium]|nr:Sir2 family NAD-dependent protein deacetylase [Flavobacteriales bacterium]
MAEEQIVVFTGAGVSAESGLRTFRDSDGLWEQYRVEDVATPEAWRRNPELVLRFYDERRAQVIGARPNAAHEAIARLQERYRVQVITQNIDDLHERAGSQDVLHLHGEILKARSTIDPTLVTPITGPSLRMGDKCALGSQLRPHIVWFGEEVPLLPAAAEMMTQAHRVLVVGTSLNVYPAASLVHHAPRIVPMVLVDPRPVAVHRPGLRVIQASATVGVASVVEEWMSEP